MKIQALNLIALVLMASASVFAQARLFELAEAPAAPTSGLSPAAVREAEITIGSAGNESQQRLVLGLFDGDVISERKSIEIRSFGDYTWRGKIAVAGGGEGDVILTFRKGFVSGLIYSGKSVYEIVPRGTTHVLIELDQNRFAECGGEVKSEADTAAPGRETALASVDSGDRIDVLVVYTTATKNILGGDAQAQTHAQQAIDATNTAYSNSKVRQRVRMVHSAEYLYTETTSGSTDLSNLRNNAAIQALRETHKADLVAMIGEIQGACGVGYLMGSNQTSGNQGSAFTVTARTCAVGNLSFAHELGHNMGSTHNPEDGSGATYPFGYGHWINGSYRTVMSYSNQCTSGCARHPYFSNPMISFFGVPTGIDNARDNARAMDLTADVIANYRYSGRNLRLLNFNGGEILPRGISRIVNWDSENVTGNVRIEISRDQSSVWQTVVPVTGNDGSEAITVWGPATKRGRIRVVSVADQTVSDSSVRNLTFR